MPSFRSLPFTTCLKVMPWIAWPGFSGQEGRFASLGSPDHAFGTADT